MREGLNQAFEALNQAFEALRAHETALESVSGSAGRACLARASAARPALTLGLS